jgi:hypothetical protein
MNWICICIGAGTSFTSVASAGPILVACPVKNAPTIPRTFASLQRFAIRSQGREIPRTIACSESIRRGMQRPGFRPNRGRTDRTLAASDAMTRLRSEGRGGRSSAVHDFGFSLGHNPKEGPGRRGPNRSGDRGGEVLPNVLPLPRKSSPKQDEPRANKMDYVIEIQGTA